jgi:aldehyde dehydrogenase (NAD+)
MARRKISYKSEREAQRDFFMTGKTLDLDYRIDHLEKLKSSIILNEKKIYEAVNSDFKKSEFEVYASETGIVLEEITHTLKNIKKWARPDIVKTPLYHFPASSATYSEPYGVVLVIAPWNYPFQLLMSPLVGAIAAGNVVSLKTPELAPATSRVVSEIIESVFEREYVSVYQGDIPVATALLKERFDYIFYTGSAGVGRIVMQAAAKNLTPVTLELGGKSPCIVDKTARLDVAARRIIWGKLINGGQTCVAPDYLLVESEIKEQLIELIISEIENFYGPDIKSNPDYCRIINDKHFARLVKLIKKEKVIYGGKVEKKERFIEPTILDRVTLNDPVMKEEIFGPILPVMEFKDIEDAIKIVLSLEKPLALYLFTGDKEIEERIIKRVPFGGGCINDTMIHVTNNQLPFGGVGQSGMGAYHGEASFRTFSNVKGILKKSNHMDLSLRYPPYTDKKLDFVKKVLK